MQKNTGKLIFLLLCFVAEINLFAQNKKSDSLISLLKTKKDTARISVLLKIAEINFEDSSLTIKKYLNEAYLLAGSSSNKKHMGDYYFTIGFIHSINRRHEISIEYFNKSYQIFKTAGFINGQISSLKNTGLSFLNLGKARQALQYFGQAAGLAKSSNNIKAEASNLYYYASAFAAISEFSEAMKYLKMSMEKYVELKDSDGISSAHIQIAFCHMQLGDNTAAIENFFKAKKILDNQHDIKGSAGCTVNMGFVYSDMQNDKKALSNFYEAEKELEAINNKDFLANVRHSIGALLIKNKEYDKALIKLEQAKETFLELGNRDYYANAIISIGEIYLHKKEYEKSLEITLKAFQIKKEVEEKDGLCICLIQLGHIYHETGKSQLALNVMEDALNISREIESKKNISVALHNLAFTHYELANFKLSAQYYKQYSELNDSIFKVESAEKIAKMEALYHTEKQAGEIQFLNQQKIAQQNELKVNGLQKNILLGGVTVLLIIAFLIYNRYRLKKRSNDELQSAYREIEKSRDEITVQKKEIVDSILYAKRIQEAILPSHDELSNNFSEHFVIYHPKDVVSGDLYWFTKIKNTFMLAAVDCTGHGVPGAFMSVIGNDLLNNSIIDKKMTDPGKILFELDLGVHASLAKGSSEKNMNDGMDVALCAIQLDKNTLDFSGAFRPLIHIRNKEVNELIGSKASVGGHLTENKIFINHHLELQKGDCIYVFTDGFVDQFGGLKGKKYKSRQLISLLKENSEKNMKEQGEILKTSFKNWKGMLEQVDDVLVIGIKI